jgi:hypothetical protein
MKKLLLIFLLMLSPVWAQTQLAPKPKNEPRSAARVDPCVPIGKTAKGELVYSLKCDLPAPPPPPQAEVKEPPPPAEPETRKSGLFGWSFDRRKPED